MADISWSDVVIVAPEMASGVAAPLQELILSYVNSTVAPSEFGGESSPRLKLARSYLAAHYAATSQLQAASPVGNITSMSEGGVSTSFSGSPMASESSLGTTNYGQVFLTFVRRSPARAGFVA